MWLYILGFLLYAGFGIGFSMWCCDYKNLDFSPTLGGFIIAMLFWPVLIVGATIYFLIEQIFEKK